MTEDKKREWQAYCFIKCAVKVFDRAPHLFPGKQIIESCESRMKELEKDEEEINK